MHEDDAELNRELELLDRETWQRKWSQRIRELEAQVKHTRWIKGQPKEANWYLCLCIRAVAPGDKYLPEFYVLELWFNPSGKPKFWSGGGKHPQSRSTRFERNKVIAYMEVPYPTKEELEELRS